MAVRRHAVYEVACPVCDTVVPREEVRFGEVITCHGCGRQYWLSRKYQRALTAISLALSGAVSYVAGLTGWAFVAGVAIGIVPAMVIVTVVGVYTVPKGLEPVD